MRIIKKLFILLVIIFLVIIIYNRNISNKKNYLSLGDGISRGIDENNRNGYGYSDYVASYLKQKSILGNYNKKFSNIDNRITDIIKDIDENVEVTENNKKITLKQALKHADIITISVGQNELLYKLNTNTISKEYIDEMILDINKLINRIQKYGDKEIYIIGYYNPYYKSTYDDVIKYANKLLFNLSIKNNLIYIDTYNLFKNNNHMININNFYPNKDGYTLIGREIVKKLEENRKNIVNN